MLSAGKMRFCRDREIAPTARREPIQRILKILIILIQTAKKKHIDISPLIKIYFRNR